MRCFGPVRLPSRVLATPRRAAWRVRLSIAALTGTMLVGGCGDDSAVGRVFSQDPAVSRWTRDSLQLAARPELLFRVIPDGGSALVAPIGTVGPGGLQALKLSARAWRQVDADYMHAGKMVTSYRAGAAGEPLRMFRGMWQPGAPPLDTLNCPVVIPMARAILTGGATGRDFAALATTGTRPPLAHGPTLSQAEIAEALQNIGTLVAPAAGIAPGDLRRYERRITQVPTGINGSSTLVVEFNDPTPLPDTLKPFGERPRQFIVALDKGTYSVRPTYSFATVGSEQTPPRLRFLDYLDVDDDGIPELFFGLQEMTRAPLYTVVLRFENDAWREVFRSTGNRCDF